MNCPKCGFSQPDDYYCANCGVNIAKYTEKKKRRHKVWLSIVLLGVTGIFLARYMSTSPESEKSEPPGASQFSTEKTKRQEETRSPLRPLPSTPQAESVSRTQSPMGTAPEAREKTLAPEPERITDRETSSRPPPGGDEAVAPQPEGVELTARQWFERGRDLDDDSDSEIQSYEKAIQLEPSFAPAHYRLGEIYYRQARYDQAEQEFAKFLQHASEEDRQQYHLDLYYSEEDMARLLPGGEETEPAEEEVSKETTPQEVGEGEAEGVGEEGGPPTGPEAEEQKTKPVAPETGGAEGETGEEAGEEVGAGAEEEVQTVVKFSASDGHIIVPVVLNGSVDAGVLLDTGSGITIVSSDLASNLGLEMERGRSIKLKTIAADVQVPVARLDSLQVGNLSRTDFLVAVTDLKLGENRKFDGILGMDFLHAYAIEIDNANSRIVLSPREQR